MAQLRKGHGSRARHRLRRAPCRPHRRLHDNSRLVVPTAGKEPAVHSAEWGILLASAGDATGVPLAVVGINAVDNGVYLAVQMLSVKDHRLRAGWPNGAPTRGAGRRASRSRRSRRTLQSPCEPRVMAPAAERYGDEVGESGKGLPGRRALAT